MNKRITTLVLFLLSVVAAMGQTAPAEGAAPAGDKFFVVGGVLAVIFTGLAVYLFLLDRKISRIEKQRKQQKG